MIRHQNAVHAVLDAHLGILARVHSLDEELPLPEFADLIGKRPIHRRIRRAHAGHVDAVEHRPLLHARTGAFFVARLALSQIFRACAQKRLAVAAGSVVHRERDHRNARVLHALQERVARLPRARRIDLLPDRPAEFLVDVFHCHRSHRGEHLQRPVRLGRPRHGQFAVREERFFAARRAEKNRAVVSGPKQFDAHIHFRRVAQPPRPQLDMLEAVAIGPQRGVVIDAARHVGPMPRLHLAVRGLFEIENVQRLGRAPNHLGPGSAVLCEDETTFLQISGDAPKRGDVRAGGQKL